MRHLPKEKVDSMKVWSDYIPRTLLASGTSHWMEILPHPHGLVVSTTLDCTESKRFLAISDPSCALHSLCLGSTCLAGWVERWTA